jgi:nucleoside-diphosphate-sugar epimerase
VVHGAAGTEIAFVVPAGIYGPSLFVDRALVPTIFTGTLMKAATGELTRYLPMPISWVLAQDVADIALGALDRGRSGARYLAMGRAEDARSIPAFCNTFLELAGIDRRVAEVRAAGGAAGDDPEFWVDDPDGPPELPHATARLRADHRRARPAAHPAPRGPRAHDRVAPAKRKALTEWSVMDFLHVGARASRSLRPAVASPQSGQNRLKLPVDVLFVR